MGCGEIHTLISYFCFTTNWHCMTHLTEFYQIDNFIDTFALGHYARVMLAQDRRTQEQVAFKVLRPEHLLSDGEMRWEYRAFGNEAHIMTALKDSPHIIKIRDCGFVATIAEAPSDGEIVSLGNDSVAFNRALYEYALKGWRPYLALEMMPRGNNLFNLMKPNTPNARWRLPNEEALTLALQFGQVLALAHSHNIVYLDHKLEHVYWDGLSLRLIDFNSSRQLNGNAKDSDKMKDIHNLCVGILYPIFTGMAPHAASLRPQPGGLDVVESRYNDIDQLDFSLEPTLSEAVQTLLQKGAAMAYPNVTAFMNDLQRVAALHGRDFPQHTSTPSTRHARDIMRNGLKDLREGTTHLKQARDAFREALTLDHLTPDLEDELRRLVKELNEMLNKRVIP
jgi:serine/threonine protein kinase